MGMKLTVPNQTDRGEPRAAVDPPVVKKLVDMGLTVAIESGAGSGSHHTDDEYRAAGAEIVGEEIGWTGDIILCLHPPTASQAEKISSGAILVGTLAPMANLDIIRKLADRNVTAFAMEFVPRISRAQAMDMLSSQANIGGYVAVIRGVNHCSKMFPMLMTAAGTISPSKVFVIGAGVAGLQAIATAKRLGAQVEAYDVRPVVKEQVQSLGARFVELPTSKQDAETKGGYAKEQTDEERRKQAELMAKHVIAADVVITTAAIFGKAPPLLIPNDVVAKLKPGAVIIDMAADHKVGRGNCEATQPDKVITTESGAVIDGTTNLSGLVPIHATQMAANNFLAFLKEIIADKKIALRLDDEIQKGALMTHEGKVVNEMVSKAMGDN